jgi:hypothetical protein
MLYPGRTKQQEDGSQLTALCFKGLCRAVLVARPLFKLSLANAFYQIVSNQDYLSISKVVV